MEERTKNFINTVIFVSRIFTGLKDKFLARKLYDKLSDLVSAYSERKGDGSPYVAQSGLSKLLTATNSLLDILDYMEHSKTTAPSPLLNARRSFFAFKLQVIRAPAKPLSVVREEKKEVSPVALKPKKEINLAGNKEKILNYIKRAPNSRTKDIIYEFSVLSERTVKRNLKELVGGGLLKRVSKDKAVYYHT